MNMFEREGKPLFPKSYADYFNAFGNISKQTNILIIKWFKIKASLLRLWKNTFFKILQEYLKCGPLPRTRILAKLLWNFKEIVSKKWPSPQNADQIFRKLSNVYRCMLSRKFRRASKKWVSPQNAKIFRKLLIKFYRDIQWKPNRKKKKQRRLPFPQRENFRNTTKSYKRHRHRTVSAYGKQRRIMVFKFS